jgi:2'-5' RNA ligase
VPYLYFTALIVPQPYRQLIDNFRMELAAKFNCRHALKTVPHITLQPPFKTAVSSDAILNYLNPLTETCHAVTISTQGFSSFDERVAFIDVAPSAELLHLQKRTNQLLHEKNVVPLCNRLFHPHITLAHRDLNPSILPELKQLAGQKNLVMKFEVNTVALLIHQNGKWHLAGETLLG